MGKRKQPDLVEAHHWFDNEIVKLRTAAAGFSGNRVWKGPRSIFKGNVEDPNGLCGDCASFVYEKFYEDFGDYRTRDGHHIALVLWQGDILNHIANAMVKEDKSGTQVYEYVGKTLIQWEGMKNKKKTHEERGLLDVPVYDLYYKKRSSIGPWWDDQSSGKRGKIKIALLHAMD